LTLSLGSSFNTEKLIYYY